MNEAILTTTTTANNNYDENDRLSGDGKKRKQLSLSDTEDEILLQSSSSSEDDDEEDELPKKTTAKNNNKQPRSEGWRVKLYRLNADGSWDDCGTGRIVCLYRPGGDASEATLCVHAEVPTASTNTNIANNNNKEQPTAHQQPKLLLRTRVLLRDAYQRQGDTIITWSEPSYPQQQQQPTTNTNTDTSTASTAGVDLALSFQDQAGCLAIWRHIAHVQNRAAAAAAHDVAVAHVATQQQRHHHPHHPAAPLLPRPPSLSNLEAIADAMAGQQRETLAQYMMEQQQQEENSSYWNALLALFPAAEERGDYAKLATLAACVKTVLLLNDPSLLEWIVADAHMFEQVCSCLEYDPDLREKAHHRWFLRERAKFRTVVPMEDPDLVAAVHKTFRVNYIKDTLLRPTMDESSLSTLSSLETFTHSDVVKGVTMAGAEADGSLYDSYLVRVMDMLCVELHSISVTEWCYLDTLQTEKEDYSMAVDPSIVVGEQGVGETMWKQYLAPQDTSLSSRRLRRRGCLSFLKELFNMVRSSLQQNDKDDFFQVICTLEIDLYEAEREIADNVSLTSQQVEVGSVASTVRSDRVDEKLEQQHQLLDEKLPPPPLTNLLSMLGCVIADPKTDVSEKSSALDIIAGIAMHDSGLIRRHCLEYHDARKQRLETKSENVKEVSFRPVPNEIQQVLFLCPPNDLMASFLFTIATATDVGLLLQVSEIMRIILDTDVMSDHGPMNSGFADEAEGILPGSGHFQHDPHNQPCGGPPTSTEQKQFLSIFYEHYVGWLVAPFKSTILHPVRRVPDHVLFDVNEPLLQRILAIAQAGMRADEPLLTTVYENAVRGSFAIELMNFCVRAHLYRMKVFLLKAGVLGNVLGLLKPRGISGDRSLKLAALRLLRAILSVNDEFYHRHIVLHDLFAPVFEALRTNPVGDNLVSSAIVEMCDFIHSENIKSLIEYIVTKHLDNGNAENGTHAGPSLEDVSSPYVSTLTVLRKSYEANQIASNLSLHDVLSDGNDMQVPTSPGGSRYFPAGHHQQINHHGSRQLSGKALEDQRKFREVDEESLYFESDDFDEDSSSVPMVVDDANAQQEGELRRTPRMFSLANVAFSNGEEGVSLDGGVKGMEADDTDAVSMDTTSAVEQQNVLAATSSSEHV
jgi:hypothetical protein